MCVHVLMYVACMCVHVCVHVCVSAVYMCACVHVHVGVCTRAHVHDDTVEVTVFFAVPAARGGHCHADSDRSTGDRQCMPLLCDRSVIPLRTACPCCVTGRSYHYSQRCPVV